MVFLRNVFLIFKKFISYMIFLVLKFKYFIFRVKSKDSICVMLYFNINIIFKFRKI